MTRKLLWMFMILAAALSSAFCGPCDDDPPPYNPFQQMTQEAFEQSQKARTLTASTAQPPPATPTNAPNATPTDIAGLDYATISPIKAVFNEAKKATTYTVALSGPFYEGADVYWSGPNCGSVSDSSAKIKATPNVGGPRPPVRNETSVLVWTHEHPPCSATTNHSDVTVVATIYEGQRLTVCTYPGSETSTGPACFRSR